MLPVLPFYVAILVVLSVFFAPNIMEALPALPKPIATIADQLSNVREIISTQLNHAEEVTESVADSIVGKVESAAGSIVKSFFDEPVVEDIIPAGFLCEHLPEWTQPYVEIASEHLNNASEIVFDFLGKLFNVISYYADIVYTHLSILATSVAEIEPIKQLIVEYTKHHNEYITPCVNYAVVKYSSLEPLIVKFFQPAIEDFKETWDSLYTGESTLPGPVLYAVVVLMLFVFINVTTRLSKLFLKDIFWINQGVTSMYGPTSSGLFAAVGGERGESYDSMKTNIDLVRDEIEELEFELDHRNITVKATETQIVSGNSTNGTSVNSNTPKSKKRSKKSKK